VVFGRIAPTRKGSISKTTVTSRKIVNRGSYERIDRIGTTVTTRTTVKIGVIMKITKSHSISNVVETAVTNLDLLTLLNRRIELKVQTATLSKKHTTRIISLIVTNVKTGKIRKADVSASTMNP
jgi:hypothetical protein